MRRDAAAWPGGPCNRIARSGAEPRQSRRPRTADQLHDASVKQSQISFEGSSDLGLCAVSCVVSRKDDGLGRTEASLSVPVRPRPGGHILTVSGRLSLVASRRRQPTAASTSTLDLRPARLPLQRWLRPGCRPAAGTVGTALRARREEPAHLTLRALHPPPSVSLVLVSLIIWGPLGRK